MISRPRPPQRYTILSRKIPLEDAPTQRSYILTFRAIIFENGQAPRVISPAKQDRSFLEIAPIGAESETTNRPPPRH